MTGHSRRSILAGGVSGALIAMAGACSRDARQATDGDLAAIDAVETADRIRRGELTPAAAVEAAIERATRIDKSINAIAAKTFRQARAEAEVVATGDAPVRPMAGVPTFVKDLDDVPGVASGYGSRAFPGYKGKAASPLVSAFLGLGVVSLGKSTTPEFGLTATTEPLSTGPTRNPWNLDHSAGGSSGGAAALVASGVVPIAHASDGGGSIRIPAACCGNVGLKATRGRVPLAREEGGPVSLSIHGVQSRTVRDTAAVIHALDVGAQVGLPPIGLVSGPASRRLRIALTTAGLPGRAAPDPEVVKAARDAAALLADLGHIVEEVPPFGSPELEQDFLLYWASYADDAMSIWEAATGLKRNGVAFEKLTLGLGAHFRAHADRYDGAVARLLAVEATYAEVYADYAAVISPVLAAPPAPIGYLGPELDYETAIARLLDYVQYTGLYNVAGAPAISLPLAMSSAGLPIGVMIGAHRGDERTLLELAFELEEAAPWRNRRPAIFG